MIRWFRRVGIAVGALLVVALFAGTIFEFASRAAAVRTYPAPGRLVDIGGRRIQLDCRGAGSPVVVFQSGWDRLGALSWASVHDQVGQFARACAYSRAGVMWSDPDGRPFSADHVAEDLHEALARAGEKPPFVLVAHSLGGPYSMVFTRLYPSEVAGVVFVDASHPDAIERLRVVLGSDTRDDGSILKLADAFAWTGIVRLLTASGLVPVAPSAPTAVRRLVRAFVPTSLHAVRKESDAVPTTLAAAGRMRRLGDRPVIVLTHDPSAIAAGLAASRLTPSQVALVAQYEATWLDMQKDQAAWSTRGRQQVVTGASHYIQFDRPGAVIAAVREVVDEVNSVAPGLAASPHGLTPSAGSAK
jgi:pimeloyl-ACP methyl ester carboxylesterase